MINTSKLTALLAAGAVSAMLAMPAHAFDNDAECNAAVAEITRSLLKANVSTGALHEIDSLIQSASGKCSSGDLSGAKADLNAARSKIAQSGS